MFVFQFGFHFLSQFLLQICFLTTEVQLLDYAVYHLDAVH